MFFLKKKNFNVLNSLKVCVFKITIFYSTSEKESNVHNEKGLKKIERENKRNLNWVRQI